MTPHEQVLQAEINRLQGENDRLKSLLRSAMRGLVIHGGFTGHGDNDLTSTSDCCLPNRVAAVFQCGVSSALKLIEEFRS